MAQTILVADDEKNIISLIKLYLTKEGFQVETAADGQQALDQARRVQPDLVMLDVMMPQLDGWEVVRRLRAESQVPVIMLTARTDDVDKIVGLELGADDYVTKPFNPRELVARVRAVLRRSQGPAAPDVILQIGDVQIDPARREVRVAGEEVQLRNKEFELLFELAKHEGRVLTRDVLLTQVWDYAYTGNSRTVDVHVTLLRDKLAASTTVEIHSVRGFGYKLVVRQPSHASADAPTSLPVAG